MAQHAKQLLKRTYYETPLQRTVIRLASVFRPPPWATPTMEFDYGVWLGPSTLHCEDGRQLGEENAWPVFFREHVATQYHASNMPGSRAGSVINMTALHMVMRTWNQTLPVMGAMRAVYDHAFGTAGQTLDMRALFVLSKMGCALPAVMVRRAGEPYRDRHLPALVATQFKLIAGFFMVAQEMLWGNARHDLQVDAAQFFDFADREHIFISPNGRACGGSRKKIIELFDYLQAVEAGADTQPLSQYANPDQLLRYTVRALYIEIVILLVQRALRSVYLQWVREQTATNGSRPAANVVTACSDISETRVATRLAHLNDNEQLWALIALLASADIEDPVSLDAAQELIEMVTANASTLRHAQDVVAHYQSGMDSVRTFMLPQQHAALAILDRSERPKLSDKQMQERLAVLPLKL